jgi:hypothetical protein
MAVLNFTKNTPRSFLLTRLHALIFNRYHEKKSCYLDALTPSELLSLNGLNIEVGITSRFMPQSVPVRGRVLAVLVPAHPDLCDSGVLFLANGDIDPEFLDIHQSVLNAVYFS